MTLRLDADVVEWFKTHTSAPDGYQAHINRALRQYVLRQAGLAAEIPATPPTEGR